MTTTRTQDAYDRILQEDPERRWELHDGLLREKPPLSFGHNRFTTLLTAQLLRQIDLQRFDVRFGLGHVYRPMESYYIPDIFVVDHPPRTVPRNAAVDTRDVYRDPVLLVVEIWSPPTGSYDVDMKLPEYRARGDREIWRLHPYDRTLTVWRRQDDGSYAETVYHHGTLTPIAFSDVTIDLDALFA